MSFTTAPHSYREWRRQRRRLLRRAAPRRRSETRTRDTRRRQRFPALSAECHHAAAPPSVQNSTALHSWSWRATAPGCSQSVTSISSDTLTAMFSALRYEKKVSADRRKPSGASLRQPSIERARQRAAASVGDHPGTLRHADGARSSSSADIESERARNRRVELYLVAAGAEPLRIRRPHRRRPGPSIALRRSLLTQRVAEMETPAFRRPYFRPLLRANSPPLTSAMQPLISFARPT